MILLLITVVSWLAVAAVLGAYASGHRRAYDIANVALFVPVCLPALILGAYSSAAISICFGVIGAVNLVRAHLRKRVRTPVRAYVAHDVDGARW